MIKYPLDYPFAHQFDRPAALFREKPEDFCVAEELGFELSGEGEHLWLFVEKNSYNTIDVARKLAKLSGCKIHEVGYAGLKDKQAISKQWFSIKRSGDFSSETFMTEGVKILSQQRNSRKLRKGSHKGNHFVITLKNTVLDNESITAISDTLNKNGVPNYFGLQRFGQAGNNILKAQGLFSGKLGKIPRFQRGIYLSAARSYLFNKLLSRRVGDGSWDKCLRGDVMALAGSASVFKAQAGDTALSARLAELDIHPTGPLWGAGTLQTSDDAEKLEQSLGSEYEDFAQGLIAAGLKQERRALRLIPEKLSIKTAGEGQVVVEFSLPKGTYATSILREMVTAPGL